MFRKRRHSGFTLIELMVSVAVLAVLLMAAVPSFEEFRQRSAIRGAADQTLSFWNKARFEATKRNQPVKVGVRTNGSAFCLGAATATAAELVSLAAGTAIASCNCFVANACDIAVFPAQQQDWRRVTLQANPTLGVATSGVTVIEPKRTSLLVPEDEGNITLLGPPGRAAYKLSLNINRFGRGTVCESTTATHRIPEFTNRRCAD
jgi:type IV fimbrial biogenesis protein FimT